MHLIRAYQPSGDSPKKKRRKKYRRGAEQSRANGYDYSVLNNNDGNNKGCGAKKQCSLHFK